jgi:hypothetical protein
MSDLFGESLTEARARLFKGITHQSKPRKCPCCDQTVKFYHRKLNSGMAATLIWLCQEWQKTQGWVNVPVTAKRFTLRAKDYSVMHFWELILNKPNDDDPRRRTSGLWIPTDRGWDFAHDPSIRIPSHVNLYNNGFISFSDTTTNIIEALGNHFNYYELMRGIK